MLFFPTEAAEAAPSFSPDGRWLAYQSLEDGINVRGFPDGGRRLVDAGVRPVWSQVRNQLYLNDASQIMVVEYTLDGGTFLPGNPRRWSELQLPQVGFDMPYDLHPDGDRFVVLLPADAQVGPQTEMTFLLNFADEVKRLTAARGESQ